MSAAHSYSFNVLFLGLFLLAAAQFLLNVSGNFKNGFYVDIIHRDSPESPLYDPSTTLFSRFQAAVNRSASRLHYLRNARFLDSISIPLFNDNYEYVMIFYIGSKSEKVFAGMDTGSELIWLLCNPCPDCYEHDHAIFDPLSSDTYRKLDCDKSPCNLYKKTICDSENKCKYQTKYIDMTYIEGILSTETFKFDIDVGNEKIALQKAIFGCTHKTTGIFNKEFIGLVGLNRGAQSLMSQLGPFFGKRFSYCLPSKRDHRTRLYFGEAAIVSGPESSITPLYHGNEMNQYYLLLYAMRVGDEEPILISPKPKKGNTILDSGTLLTYIEPSLQKKVFKKVKKHIPLPLKPHDNFELCFDTNSFTKRLKLPKISFIFDNKAEFLASKRGVFKQVDKNTLCCLIKSTGKDDTLQVIGSIAQADYRIGYDIQKDTVTFSEEDC